MTVTIRKTDIDPKTLVLLQELPSLQAPQAMAKLQTQPACTGIHPLAVAVPLAATAWFLVAAWLAFGGGEMNLIVCVIAIFSLLYLGLLAGGGARAYNQTPKPIRQCGFREFLHGEVDIATGRIAGRDALLQIITMPLAFAIGFTVIAIIATMV